MQVADKTLRSAPPYVKICGITTQRACDVACDAGASFIGFVCAPSPRHIHAADAASIAAHLPPHIRSVAVCVDPDDETLDAILLYFRPDFIQLHGHETPQRAHEITLRTQIPIIKALRIAEKADLLPASSYAEVASILLFDAKIADSSIMGGTGHSFDWQLLRDFTAPLPWFLSGGLNAGNVQDALQHTGAHYIDVSSGVESQKGIKDLSKIASFMEAAKGHR